MGLIALARLALEDPTAVPADRGVLYASGASVLVALIGGVVAVLANRGRPSQTTEAGAELPREMVGLLTQGQDRDAARIAELEDDVGLWMSRAYEAGWRP